jgi:putative endonuclease
MDHFWFVYVIKSDVDGRLYKGMSQDVQSRLNLHNRGKVKSTSAYRPWKIIYVEECENSLAARQREKFLKSPGGRLFLRSLSV